MEGQNNFGLPSTKFDRASNSRSTFTAYNYSQDILTPPLQDLSEFPNLVQMQGDHMQDMHHQSSNTFPVKSMPVINFETACHIMGTGEPGYSMQETWTNIFSIPPPSVLQRCPPPPLQHFLSSLADLCKALPGETVKQTTVEPKEFSITTEDFPELPCSKKKAKTRRPGTDGAKVNQAMATNHEVTTSRLRREKISTSTQNLVTAGRDGCLNPWNRVKQESSTSQSILGMECCGIPSLSGQYPPVFQTSSRESYHMLICGNNGKRWSKYDKTSYDGFSTVNQAGLQTSNQSEISPEVQDCFRKIQSKDYVSHESAGSVGQNLQVGGNQSLSPDNGSLELSPDFQKTANQCASKKANCEEKKSMEYHPDGTVTNIPSNVLHDQYGIAGLLAFVKEIQKNSSLSETIGQDMTQLGLDLNSPRDIHINFEGPFVKTKKCFPLDMKCDVPPEYVNPAVR